MELTLDTWIISDTHFGHENIVKFCNRPSNHDAIMVTNWIYTVGSEDPILHLGDLAYRGDRDKNHEILKELPGQKYFIWGNHDKQKLGWYESAGFTQVGKLLGEFVEEDLTREGVPYRNVVKNWGFYWQNGSQRILFSHYPDNWLKDWDLNIHGHIHNNPYSPKIADTSKYRNVSVELMQYSPIRLREILCES